MKTSRGLISNLKSKHLFSSSLGLLMVFLLIFTVSPFAKAQDLLFSITSEQIASLNLETPSFLTTTEALTLLNNIKDQGGFPVTDNFYLYTKAQGEYLEGIIDTKIWLQDFFEQYKGDFIRWPLQDQYDFDQLMLSLKITDSPYCFLPQQGELSQEEAVNIIKQTALEYDLELLQEDFDSFQAICSSFCLVDGYTEPVWKIILRKPSPDFVALLSKNGDLLSFERQEGMEVASPLLNLLSSLEKEKGLFQFWSLEDKAWMSAILPAIIDKEMSQGNKVFPIAYAIASYRFTMPPDDAITLKAATTMAINACQKNFSLPSHWLECMKIGASFFYNDENIPTWRITFWQASSYSVDGFYGARVEINAITGQIVIIEKNGNTMDTTIPYENRI